MAWIIANQRRRMHTYEASSVFPFSFGSFLGFDMFYDQMFTCSQLISLFLLQKRAGNDYLKHLGQ